MKSRSNILFQASINPERTTVGLFPGCEPQAHPPYSVFNFQELALCILQENWVKCLCGGISAAVCVRERERETLCVFVTLTLAHFSSQTPRGRLKSFIQTGMIRQNI